MYKQTITKTGSGRVLTAYDITGGTDEYYDIDEYAERGSFYAFKGDKFGLVAEPSSGYTFASWTSGRVSKAYEDEDYTYYESIVEGTSTYTAAFRTGATGLILKATSGKKSSDGSGAITVSEKDVIKFEWIKTPDKDATYNGSIWLDYDSSYFEKVSDTELRAKRMTPVGSPARVRVKCNPDTLDIENSIYVTINERTYTESKFTIKASEPYLTDGYSIDLIPDFSKIGSIEGGIIWKVEGEGTLTGLSMFTLTDKKEINDLMGVELKATEGKVESGKTGKIKVTATIPQGYLEPAKEEIEITVYPKNTLSYSTSEKTLSFTNPDKVNTGKKSGVEGDNKDNTKTAISEVKGVKIHVLSGDKFLGQTSIAKDKGKSGTIDSATVGKITGSVSSSLSGDSADIKIRAFPCDSDGKYNKNVYATTSLTVYRVVINYTKADGSTADYITYRPEGSKFNAADAIAEVSSAADGKVTQIDGSNDTTITVSSSAAQNKHTAVLGASRANAAAANGGGANASARADDSGLDKVPKTGQDNTFVFVMVAIVVCAVGGGLYVYNKKVKKA